MVPLKLMSTFKNDVVVESTSFLFRWILMSEFFLESGTAGEKRKKGRTWCQMETQGMD